MEKIQQRLAKFKQKQKGFTLVELIVVIAIIGILAAILLPKYFGFTDKAKISAAVSDAKSIRSIAETYYAQNSVWPSVTTSAAGSAATPGVVGVGASGDTGYVAPVTFVGGTATSILKIKATTPPSTISSPTFNGYLGNYSSGGAVGTPLTEIPADGSFNYTSNTGHTVTCDPNGTVTDIN